MDRMQENPAGVNRLAPSYVLEHWATWCDFRKAQLSLRSLGSTMLIIHFFGSLTASSRMKWINPVTDTPDRFIRVGTPLNWAERQRLASLT